MVKRCLLILTILCLCAFSAFSLDSGKKSLVPDFSVSAGGRIFYNGMFNIWDFSNNYNHTFTSMVRNGLYGNHGFGIGGFFDATYVEIGLDFIFGSFKPISKYYSGDFEMKSTQFGFSILGKYPFAVGDMTVFPLLGIDYQIFISGEAYGISVSHDDCDDMYDAFSFAVGGGLDYNLGGKLYLRGELLFNFKKDSKFESELRDIAKKNEIGFPLFTFGPRISIGVGYKF
jgi:opacity protein-like surface antigen